MVVIVMGVSGAGKTTVGRALAEALGWRFVDADDLHPKANVEKMAAGVPLTDEDRWPWLAAIRQVMADALARGEDLVLANSALKKAYRDRLAVDPERVRFVYLDAPREVLAHRLSQRQGHFMPPSLLDSQLATLEPPLHALIVDVTPPPPEVVKAIRRGLGL
ncbi:gluconokinase [Pyxidicoccus xibeiensis]|uniref:gluconokinase n=1 Tax=Pyxidicoccus xibeiensis TaxID=2906759 RepID=UPI0020A717C3|nr:gluconokinase [Pyxidicoccus xibeiensis]MCP3136236.1 gluconokinase [Pyxidicoccus xibeiensis]